MDGALCRELDKLWATTTAVRTRAALTEFAALLFPTECVGCGLPDASLCAGCSAAFRSATVRPFRAEAAAEALPDRYPLRPDPLPGDPVRPESLRPDPLPGDPVRPESLRPDPLLGDPLRPDPLPWDPVRPESLPGDPVRPESLPGDPVPADWPSAHLLSLDQVTARPLAGDGSEPLPVVSAGIYSGGVAQVVLAFKNHGHTDLAPQLLAALAGALHYAARTLLGSDPAVTAAPITGTAAVLLVPVPGKGSSFRRRGYDPLGLLLHRLARRKLLPEATAVGAILTYTHRAALLHSLPAGRQSSGQKGLGRRKRRTSVRGSMRVRRSAQRSLAGRTCIIIDDVLTTGATIAEAARVLHLAGATVAGAVVVAATSGPRRDNRHSALPPPPPPASPPPN